MKIIGFGYPCMDMNILCPSIPEEEELVELRDISLMGGGKVANAITAAARLGGECGFIGVAGREQYGRLCADDLEHHGVDISHLYFREGHTALCLSIVDEKKRGKHYIESPATTRKMEPEELDAEYLKTAEYLLLYELDSTALKAAEIVRGDGGKVIVDGDTPDPRIQNNMDKIDVLIASEYYYRARFNDENYEEHLRELAAQGPKTVIITLGNRGSVGLEDGIYFHTKAFHVDVKDTTGAGDAFHGAFAYGLADNMSARESARLASAVSAIKCTVLGGRTGLPDLKCVQHFMETGEIIETDFDNRIKKYREDMWYGYGK